MREVKLRLAFLRRIFGGQTSRGLDPHPEPTFLLIVAMKKTVGVTNRERES